MPPGGGCRHSQARIAAKGAKQQASGFLDVGQGNRRIGILLLRGAGDEAVPQCADVLFQVNRPLAGLAAMQSA